jgi:hypothetical protein
MAFTTVQYIKMVSVANVPVAVTTQYTVPAARQDVVKTISVANTTSTAQTFTLTIAGVTVVPATSIPGNQTMVMTGTWVMNAAETIATASSGVAFALIVSGLESQ